MLKLITTTFKLQRCIWNNNSRIVFDKKKEDNYFIEGGGGIKCNIDAKYIKFGMLCSDKEEKIGRKD